MPVSVHSDDSDLESDSTSEGVSNGEDDSDESMDTYKSESSAVDRLRMGGFVATLLAAAAAALGVLLLMDDRVN